MSVRKLPRTAGWRAQLAGSAVSTSDQGLQAAFSLVIAVYVSRTLGVDALGVYASVYVLVFVSRAVEDALVLRPMSVLGPRVGATERPYQRVTLGMQMAVAVFVAALGALVGAVLPIFLGGGGLAWRDALFASAAFVPAQGLFNWSRRVHYVAGRPARALLQSGISVGVSTFLLLAFHVAAWRSVMSVFTALAVGTMAAAAPQVVRVIGREFPHPGDAGFASWCAQHWSFGMWILLSVPFALSMTQGYFILVSAVLGAKPAGVLKSLDALIAPFDQVCVAVSLFLTPQLAARADRMSPTEQRRWLLRSALALGGAALAYASFVGWFGRGIVTAVFALDADAEGLAVAIMPIILAIPLARSFACVASMLIMARMCSDRVLLAYLAAAVGTAVVGVPAVFRLGLAGAALGMLAAVAIQSAGLWLGLTALWRREAR